MPWPAYTKAMATEPITLMVSPETAKVFRETTDQGRLKMETAFELWARPIGEAEMKPLEERRRELIQAVEAMRDMAAANGLTEEILEEILSEE